MGGWFRRVFIAIALALSLLVSTEAASSSRATTPRKALKPSIYVKTPANGSKISGRVVWKAGYTGQTPGRVEFRIDGVKRWTDRRAPFRFKGDTGYLDAPTLMVGAHTLTVIAFRRNRSQSSSWLVRAAVFARAAVSTSRTTRKTNAKIRVTVGSSPTAPANTSLPTASGTPAVGQTLTASSGSWTGSLPITNAYAWLRCSNTSDAAACSSIAQATASSYPVTSADTGYYLRVKVTATNSVASASALSAATAQVTAAPANTSLPTASGTPVVGQTLTASSGSWTGSQPINYAYAWLRCSNTSDAAACSSIAQATASSYPVTSADTGYYLRAKVTATNSVASASALSAATAQVTGPPSDGASGALTATPLDSSHIQLSWGSVDGAGSYEVYRGTLLVIQTSQTSAVDRMLWPQTSYSYTVNAVSSSGAVLTSLSASATTTQLPQGGFLRPFSSGSVWNTPVGNAETVANNAALMTNFEANAFYPNMALHRWAVSVAETSSTSPLFNVPCLFYNPCTLSALGAIPIPITAAADPSSDGHLAIYDPNTQREWDMWQAVNTGLGWTASAGAAVSTSGDGIAPSGTAGSNAANFPLLGGLIRPEEILQGRIDHALVFGMPGVNKLGHVCPATHNDGSSTDPSALQEGAHLQLDPSIDVNALPIPTWQKTIARALQVYGMYLRDQGGTLSLYAENPISRGYDAWANLGLGGINSASLSGIPWNRFRVIAPPC